jgi:hypothetical protein
MSITSQEKKTYFLLLGADVPPEAALLGHIIVDPTRPERALNTPLTPIPAYLSIYKTDLREYSRTFDATQFSGVGLLARFLHFFSLGIEGSGGISNGTQELQSYSVQDMHTEWLENRCFIFGRLRGEGRRNGAWIKILMMSLLTDRPQRRRRERGEIFPLHETPFIYISYIFK